MDLLAPSCCCSIIDWCKVSEIAFNALATGCFVALFTVGLGVAAGYAVDRLNRRPRFKQQEDILRKLAELRLTGVRLRNKGAGKILDGADFAVWNDDVDAWKKKLFRKAGEFSPVENERLQTLDDMPAQVFAVQNDKQIFVLRYVSETLRRLDRMLEQRFRPTLAP